MKKINRKKNKKTIKQRKKAKFGQKMKNPKETKNEKSEKTLKVNFFPMPCCRYCVFSVEGVLKTLIVKIYSKRV